MTSSAPSSPPLDDEVAAIACQLAGRQDAAVTVARRGGNNRLYRVAAGGAVYALKLYMRDASDSRDRLDTEFRALAFLSRHGVDSVPQALARDDHAGAGLYSWVHGAVVDTVCQDDADQAVNFLSRLHELRHEPGAAELPLASEACLSLNHVLDQIHRREARLREVARNDGLDTLLAFLDGEFSAVFQSLGQWAEDGYRSAGWDAVSPHGLVSLSPSDFGFHNALRHGARLTFVDFEYFGRDDPVKLVADTLWHPGFAMPSREKQQFVNRLRLIYGADENFAQRLRLLSPLFGLRWCMIVLNEFLPERWRRRAYAGSSDRLASQHRQLQLARALLAEIRHYSQGTP